MNEKAILDARARASAFWNYCRGLEALGDATTARDGRALVDSLLQALDAVEAERSVRVALQERCEVQQDLLAKAAYQACVRASA